MGKEYLTRNKRNTLLAAVANQPAAVYINWSHRHTHTHHLMADGTLHLHLFNKEWAAIFSKAIIINKFFLLLEFIS